MEEFANASNWWGSNPGKEQERDLEPEPSSDVVVTDVALNGEMSNGRALIHSDGERIRRAGNAL